RKHDAIELKNLLISTDNLIAECLSQEVFCVATNSELNVARFTEMHVANTAAEARCLALEAGLLIYLKYQNLKDSIGNNPPTPAKDVPDFDSVFVISKMQASLQGKDNVIRQLKKKLSHLQVTHSDTDRHEIDPLSLPTVTLSTPRNYWNMRLALVLKALNNKLNSLPTFLSLERRVNSCPNASGSQPKSHVKSNKILPAKGVNKLLVEDQPRTNKSHLITSNRVGSSSRLKHTAKVVATACYTQNRSLIHTRHHKTPYELVHNKNPDLTFFRVFGALCYPTNDSEDLEKLQPTADTRIFVGYAPSRKGTGPAPNFMTPGQISSGLVQNTVPATPSAPSTNKELEILFQTMFDEYLEPPRGKRPVPPAQAEPTPFISAAEPNYMEERTNALVHNPPFVNVFAPEPHYEASSSGDISSAE
nr:hypothetical protein [Tanacetum cinerariifolium]